LLEFRLPSFSGATSRGRNSQAYAVNFKGQVVGSSETTDGALHAFSWTEGDGMIDLGTLGGRNSQANSVNDRGDVVGYSDTPGAYHAVLWQIGRPRHDFP
jgi:probable HAF family extracellular repeat protein